MLSQLKISIPANSIADYPIFIAADLLAQTTVWLPKKTSKVVIITDDIVKEHYALRLKAALAREGRDSVLLSFPAGESAKNIETKCKLEAEMLQQGCDRNSLILALGGGVVSDLAGFIAATYMRGIAYINLPTSLLAMVDSSIGGKTGIDTPYGKNLIGAFWQPKAVVIDLACIKTLPQKQLINGLIEAIKMFSTNDVQSLRDLDQNLSHILQAREEYLSKLIVKALTIKAKIIEQDVYENSCRAILNFGHTIGHALEKLSDYQLLHGYAVALGMLVEAKIAQLLGLLEAVHYSYIKALLQRLEISATTLTQFNVDAVIKTTYLDKKTQSSQVNYVLLNDLGSVYIADKKCIHAVSDEVVRQAFLHVIEEVASIK